MTRQIERLESPEETRLQNRTFRTLIDTALRPLVEGPGSFPARLTADLSGHALPEEAVDGLAIGRSFEYSQKAPVNGEPGTARFTLLDERGASFMHEAERTGSEITRPGLTVATIDFVKDQPDDRVHFNGLVKLRSGGDVELNLEYSDPEETDSKSGVEDFARDLGLGWTRQKYLAQYAGRVMELSGYLNEPQVQDMIIALRRLTGAASS